MPSHRSKHPYLRRTAYAFVAFAMAALSLTFTAASAQAAPMTVTQSYSASTVYVNSPFTLAIAFDNSTGVRQTGIGFTYTLPSNLTFFNGPGSSYTQSCPASTLSSLVTNSLTTLQVADGYVERQGTCSIAIRVMATATGSYVGAYSGVVGMVAPADVTLTVVDPSTQPRWAVCPAEGMLYQDAGPAYSNNAGTTFTIGTSLTQINLATSVVKPWPLPSNPGVALRVVDASLNGVGFLSSPAGGFVWGWDLTDQSLVRIGGDGSVVSFGNLGLTDSITTSFNMGDVSPGGIMYLAQSSGGNTALAEVDLTGPTPVRLTGVTSRSLNPGTGMADWSYNPSDGALYGVGPKPSGGSSTFYLWKTDPATGAVTAVAPLPGIPVGQGANWGADYIAPDASNPGSSYLYASNNTTGNIYRVSLVGAASAASLFIPSGPPSNANDGARCATAPLKLDFGDAPDSYGTTLASNGPRDGLWSTPGSSLQIGATNTSEDDGQPSAAANLDAGDDGVAPFSLVAGTPSTVPVMVTNTTAYDAVLAGWIDLNENGVFDSSERVTAVAPAGSGTTVVNLAFPATPATFTGVTYGRFRLQSEQDGTISNPLPTGVGAAGEVEDWASVPPTIEVAKVISSRYTPTDEFTVSVTGTGIGSPNTATTIGSATTITTGPVIATYGYNYVVSETAASGNLANYQESYSCVDTAYGGVAVVSGVGASGSLFLPHPNSSVRCTFTNTALPIRTLTVNKNVVGRFNANDEFTITAAGNELGVGSSATTTGTANGVQSVVVGPLTVTRGLSYAVSEIGANGANLADYTTTYSCSANGGAPFATGLGSTATVTIPTGAIGDVVCTFTDTPLPSIEVSKVVASRYLPTDEFTVSVTGAGLGSPNTATTVASQSTVTTGRVSATYGQLYVASESAASGDLANYASTYVCVDNAHGGASVAAGSGTSASFSLPQPDSIVLCTFTNTAKSVPTLTVKENIAARFNSGDQFTIIASGNDLGTGTGATTTGSTTGVQAGAIVGPLTVTGGSGYTISEVASSGTDLNDYTVTYSCSNNGAAAFITGSTATGMITVPAVGGTNVVCAFLNSPRVTVAAQSDIVSRYGANDQFTLSVTGGSIISGNTATTSGSTLGVQSGAVAGPYFAQASTTYTFAETAAAGSLNDYISSYVCVDVAGGNTTPFLTGGGTSATLQVPSPASQVVCTFTNTASPSIVVSKVVVSRYAPTDEFTVSVTGPGIGSPNSATTVGSQTTVTTGRVPATFGQTYLASESAAAGDLANYNSSFSCADGAHGDASVIAGSGTSVSFSLPQSDSIVTCTFTNTAKSSPVLTVQNDVVGRFTVGDQFTITASGNELGGGTSATSAGTAAGIQAAVVGPLVVTGGPGYSISEVAANGADLADYTSTYSCSANGAAPFAAGLGSTATVSVPTAAAGDVVCTFTNVPLPSIAVSKVVVSRYLSTDEFTVSVTGVGLGSPTSVTTSGSQTTVTTGPVSATYGQTYVVSELAASGDLANYQKSYSCLDTAHGSASVATGNGASVSFSLPQPDSIVLCTFTNTAKPAPTLTVKGGPFARFNPGDQFTISASGNELGTGSSATTTGTVVITPTAVIGPFAVTQGLTYLISEVAAGGADLANYTVFYTCSNNGTAPFQSGTTSTASITIPSAAGSNVVCTIADFALPTVGSQTNIVSRYDAGDQFTVGVTGGSITSGNTATTAGSVLGLQTDAIAGPYFAETGTSYTFAETAAVGSLSHYSTTYTCLDEWSGTATPFITSGTGATVTLLSSANFSHTVCTFTNTANAKPIIGIATTSSTTTVAPGGPVHYSVVVTNTGTVDSDGTTVSDSPRTGIASFDSWSCAASGGALCPTALGTGAIGDTLATLPAGSSVTYTIDATASATPPAIVQNTASATPPSGGTCSSGSSVPPPCTATVTISPDPIITILKTADVTALTPNGIVVYTVHVTNTGVTSAAGTVVSDPLPAGIAAFSSWSCAASGGALCPAASGAGALNETIAVYPAGSSLTYTITARASASLPLSTVNTASAVPPAGGLCGAALTVPPCVSTVSLSPIPEVTITKVADRISLLPSGTVVYTVVGSNVGLVAADGSVIDDPIVTGLTSYSWSCASTGGALCPTTSGAGAVHETIAAFPAGGTVRYTVTAQVASTPGSSVTNRATITPPSGDCGAPSHLTPPCVATVTMPVASQVSIVNSAGVAVFTPSSQIAYTLLVTNTGSVPADGTEVLDPIVTGFTDYSWTCTAVGTTCPNVSGTGAIDENLASFPVGSAVTYRVVATVSSTPPALISATATAALAPGGLCSPNNQPGPCTSTVALLSPALAATGAVIGGQLILGICALLVGSCVLLTSRLRRRRRGSHAA
ncbi:MAG: hypothetical protein JWN80_251 [Microbacteriaceae bacterium]|nr:hypothetical protein [Microbacteriaceae bacterium]